MKKKYAIMSLVLIIALILGACSQTPTTSNEPTGTTSGTASSTSPSSTENEMTFPTEELTLSYTWWGNQVRHERTQKVVNMFIEKHPNITIEVEFPAAAEYSDKLLTLISTGNTPDIFQTEYEFIPRWVVNNVAESFEPYIDAGIIDLSKCTSLDACRFDGDLYAHNLGLNGPSIMYDINLLNELGIAINPDDPWTWDDFLKIGKEVFDKSGVKTSLWITFRPTDWIRCSARNEKQTLFFDNSKLGITDPQIVKRVFDIFEKAVSDGFAVPADFYASYSSVEQQAIVTGEAWNACLTSNMIVGLQNAVGEERPIGFKMIPDFAGAQQPGQFLKPSQVICISKTSTDAEKIVAANYINFMVSDVSANKVLLGERGVPCNSEVIEAIKGDVDVATQRMFDFISIATKYAPPLETDDVKFVQELTEYSKIMAESVWNKLDTAQSATDKFFAKADELISEANK